MTAFINALFFVVVAEMGDKTQLLAMAMASKYKAKQVLIGVFIATIFNHALAVAVGSYMGSLIPIKTIQIVASISFLIFGLWTLRGDKIDDEKEKKSKFGPIATVTIAFFLAEMGDKTQLMTIAIAADYNQPLLVLLGTTAGMMIADGIGIIGGAWMCKNIPEVYIKWIAGIIFMFFGTLTLYNSVPKYMLSLIYIIPYFLIIGALIYLVGVKLAYKDQISNIVSSDKIDNVGEQQIPVAQKYSPQTKAVLDKLNNNKNNGKTFSGQFFGYSGSGFEVDSTLKPLLNSNSNKTPGIMSVDIAYGADEKGAYLDAFDNNCNDELKAHWQKGGLVSIGAHMPNPFGWTNSRLYCKEANPIPNEGLNSKDINEAVNAIFSNTNNTYKKNWNDALSRIYSCLYDLKKQGVVVMFKPLHDMNGNWFWWGDLSYQNYKKLYQSMYNYMNYPGDSGRVALDNVLWVYAPDSKVNTNVKGYYPGNKYVDIVGLDAYLAEPNNVNNKDTKNTIENYKTLTGEGFSDKVFAFTEIGPNDNNVNASYDYNSWVTSFNKLFPKTTYFIAWKDFSSNNNKVLNSPSSVKGAKDLYNNSRVINSGKLH